MRHAQPPAAAAGLRRMPSPGILAVAAFVGIVFGAMGLKIAAVIQVTALILIAVGVWRGVDVLVDIYNRLDTHPDPAQHSPRDKTRRFPA